MPAEVRDDIEQTEDLDATDPSSGSETDDSEGSGSGTTDRTEDAGDEAGDGPIPLDRHKRILEGTRQEYEERYGWAEELDRNRVERALAVLEELDSNPRRVFSWLSDRLKGEVTEAPGPDLKTEDGRLLYSAEQAQKLVDYRISRFQSEVDERLGGVESTIQQGTAKEEARVQVEEARSWPHFEANLPAINDALKAAQRAGRPISLERAYLTVVLPKIRQFERQSIADEMKHKPGPQDRPGGRRPAGQRVSDSDRPLSELITEEMKPRRQ